MNKALLIARWEFLATVTRRAYIFAVVAMPLLFGIIVGLTGSYSIGLAFVAAHCVVAALLFLLVMGPIERVGEESDRPASYNNQEKEDGIKAM